VNFTIEHESGNHLRIRLVKGFLRETEADVLQAALHRSHRIREARVFRATGGISLTYTCGREEILQKLHAFQFSNIEKFAKDMEAGIGLEEMQRRKLTPELKKKLRTRMLLEMAADIVLPVPLQMGYHVYQMITLRDI